MVFKAKGAHTFKIKFSLPTRNEGKPRTVSTGATNKSVAQDVERMVERMKSRRQWEPLEAVFDDLISLAAVYDADVSGTLAATLAALRDTDLDPLVTEWAGRAFWRYPPQVRAFIPEGERFPASEFRRKRISEFLAELTCAPPTKNRYRAALSVFAKWLVEREVIESNPVRDVAMYKENDPRMVWMTWDDAWRVSQAAPKPYSGLFALMAATGIELGAALRLTRSDIDYAAWTIHARGSKTTWRNRVVKCEAWAIAEVAVLGGDAIGPVPLFPPMKHRDILAAFRAAQKAVGLSGHRLHDLRHTYAVNALKKGYKPTVVAHQLGHKDATMVTKVYGRFIPDESDYTVTNSATSIKKPREVKRAK